MKIMNNTVPKKYAGCIPPVDTYSLVLFEVWFRLLIAAESTAYNIHVLISFKFYPLLSMPDKS